MIGRLLIVEDEKLIREGIKAIVQRASVNIGTILEARNGEIALDIVKEQQIDVMLTDIRMPRMDGITLVKEAKKAGCLPKTVVISGYDDFSYAVELLRCGAKEYILKPVEREVLYQILTRLDTEIEQEKKQSRRMTKLSLQHIRFILLSDEISTYEMEEAKISLSSRLGGEYLIGCVKQESNLPEFDEGIVLKDMGEFAIVLMKAEYQEQFLLCFADYSLGLSRNHTEITQMKQAYQEAVYARKQAYFSGEKVVYYHLPDGKCKKEYSEEQTEQIVQWTGAGKNAEIREFFAQLSLDLKSGLTTPAGFEEMINRLLDRIKEVYSNVLGEDEDILESLSFIYRYAGFEEYIKQFFLAAERIQTKLSEYEGCKNMDKIQKALDFIHENFSRDLNMAVVSNYVSMNYSLFSSAFKQYTGLNFVSYLKELRIKEAKRLLASTDMTIAEISMMAGYENEKHFMKIFKNSCGVSPTEYRRNAQIGHYPKDRG